MKPGGGESGLCSRFRFHVKQFFLNKNSPEQRSLSAPGGGYLVKAGPPVNRPFRAFVRAPGEPCTRTKIALGLPRGFPHKSRRDSIGAAGYNL